MNTNDYNILIDTIKQIARSECQRIMKNSNVASNFFATVIGVNENKTYNVMIPGGITPYTNIVNKTGEAIDVGDIVLIEALNGNIGNGYIKLKQGISSSPVIYIGTSTPSSSLGSNGDIYIKYGS